MIGADLGIHVHADGAERARRQLQDVDRAVERTGHSTGRMGGQLGGAQRAMAGVRAELGGLVSAGALGAAITGFTSFATTVLDATRALQAFATEGAIGNDVARNFQGNMDALNASVANTLDETSLQRFFGQFSDIGLAAEDIEFLNKRMTELTFRLNDGRPVAEGLQKVLMGSAEGLREYGVVVDISSKQFQGFTETQKKLAIALEIAAQGRNTDLDSIDSQTLAIRQAETQWANFVSTVQGAVADVVTSSGALGNVESIMDELSRVFAENKDEIQSLIETGFKVVEKLLPGVVTTVQALGIAFENLEPVIGLVIENLDLMTKPLQLLVDGYQYLTENTMDWEGVSPRAIAAASEIRDHFFGAAEAAAEAAVQTHDYADALRRVTDAQPLSLLSHDFAKLREEVIGAANGADILASTIVGQAKDYDDALRMLSDFEDATASLADSMLYSTTWGQVVEEAQAQIEASYSKTGKAAKRLAADAFDPAAAWTFADEIQLAMAIVVRSVQGTWQEVADYSLERGGGLAIQMGEDIRKGLDDVLDRAGQAYRGGRAARFIDDLTSKVEKFGDSYVHHSKIIQNEAQRQEQFISASSAGVSTAINNVVSGAIQGGQSFSQLVATQMGPLFGQLSSAFLAAATAEGQILAGNPWGAAAAAIALGVVAAAISAFANRGKAGGGGAAVAPAQPTRLAMPEQTRRQRDEKEVIIVQLDIDGRRMARQLVRNVNQLASEGSGVQFVNSAVATTNNRKFSSSLPAAA